MDVKTATDQLIQALANTKEYINLRNIKTEINKDGRLRQSLEQFQNKQQMLYTSKLSQDQAQAMMNELNADYEKLSAIPLAARYFSASESFSALLDNVINSVNNVLAV